MLAPSPNSPEDGLPEHRVRGRRVRIVAGCSTSRQDQAFIAACQRLRGLCYLEDGAVAAHELTADGRLERAADHEAVHFAVLDENDQPIGTASFRIWDGVPDLSQLLLGGSPLFDETDTRARFRQWCQATKASDRRSHPTWSEPYGLAVAHSVRGTRVGLLSILSGWSVGRLAHGAIGICLTTQRHDTSGIFVNLGHQPVIYQGTEIGPAYDSRFNCEMRLTACSSLTVKPAAEALVNELTEALRPFESLIQSAIRPVHRDVGRTSVRAELQLRCREVTQS